MNFRDVYSKKKIHKKNPHRTFTARAPVNLPHNRTCGAASLVSTPWQIHPNPGVPKSTLHMITPKDSSYSYENFPSHPPRSTEIQ